MLFDFVSHTTLCSSARRAITVSTTDTRLMGWQGERLERQPIGGRTNQRLRELNLYKEWTYTAASSERETLAAFVGMIV
jgi:hypothetical protein